MVKAKPAQLKGQSSELGSGDFAISYNSRTGRPIRGRSTPKAGKADSPFVDSAVAISDEDEDSDGDEIIPVPRPRKRKRSPSPPLSEVASELDVITDDDEYAADGKASAIEVRPRTSIHVPAPPTANESMQFVLKDIVINVPKGHTGPIVLHLTPGMAVPAPPSPPPLPMRIESPSVQKKQSIQRKRSRKEPKPKSSTRAGFLDLPAELRNEVYRLVFVTEGRLNFASPTNFARSAALLRTCRQVHDEAPSILYGENEFYFNRRTSRYGSFWKDDWSELGFKSIRKFFKAIGPLNTSLLRNISFQFEDATPCLNPDTMSHEERRFVHDPAVMSCLKHLGDFAQLQSLKLNFHGRRRVETSDDRFLANLKRIKADSLEIVRFPIGLADSSVWAMDSKQEESVRKSLLKVMVRKPRERLYD